MRLCADVLCGPAVRSSKKPVALGNAFACQYMMSCPLPQELWKAVQEQINANELLLQRLSAKAGLPSSSHTSAAEGIERMQLMLGSAIQ